MGYTPGYFRIKLNAIDASVCMRRRPAQVGTSVAGVFSPIRVEDPRFSQPLFVPFMANTNDPTCIAAAVHHRIGCQRPQVDKTEGARFRRFVSQMLRLWWPSTLKDGDVKGYQAWLESTSYSGSRRAYFKKLHDEHMMTSERDVGVDAFIKNECYYEPKQPRAILSYSDNSKNIVGAVQEAVDHLTFSHRNYVKYTDPKTWGQRLSDLFGSKHVIGTDFSSFEAHHEGVFAEVIHDWMVYMTASLTGISHYHEFVRRMVLGVNKIRFKTHYVWVMQRLMSGAMWTSSANGFLNLMIMSYLFSRHMPEAQQAEWAAANFVGLCEGDDGLTLQFDVDYGVVAKLGLNLKFTPGKDDKPITYDQAGFCGIYCDPVTLESVRDPMKVLQKAFVHSQSYKDFSPKKLKALARNRALSTMYLCNDNPILGELCHWICRRTSGIQVDEREKPYLYKIDKEVWKQRPVVSDTSRMLVERNFGVSVHEQLELEDLFRNANTDVIYHDMTQFTQVTKDMIRYALDFVADSESWTAPRQIVPDEIRAVVDGVGVRPKCKAMVVRRVDAHLPE